MRTADLEYRSCRSGEIWSSRCAAHPRLGGQSIPASLTTSASLQVRVEICFVAGESERLFGVVTVQIKGESGHPRGGREPAADPALANPTCQ
jgi:hypothetical protein